ncbi:MAG: tetratricopeptide repeat protein, partial [Planctomycetia bacterium]|nr:tetratricopeptide repeat protein [Planctomycetia bacterium]
NVTSEAYVEAAGCCENLGMWEKARQYYELYAKKFPKYKHIALCKARLAQLEEIQQYADFIASNPASPKLAEARYQIATVLYKKLKNPIKAAMAFRTLAAAHPKHARAPEGMFMAGTAQLHAQNFPAAREAFAELVRGYPESRLADDGQYWIGHTYEYSARAIGKLDNRRIILKRRSLRARARLRDDLPLRRHYNPEAKPGHAVPEDVWGGDTLGVLASGSVRDRVNADLFRAIRAYRKVADNFKMGDMAGPALLRIGTIYVKYLKDPDRGIGAYQELLAHYPASAGAVDALFEVGGYHTKKNNFDDAIKAYRQFIYNYPKDARVAEARLAIARCYVEKKDWHKALDAYQSYLNKFPDAEQADFAKAQVEWIRMYHF